MLIRVAELFVQGTNNGSMAVDALSLRQLIFFNKRLI